MASAPWRMSPAIDACPRTGCATLSCGPSTLTPLPGDRSSILIEDSVEAFAEVHGFRLLADDGIATNPLIHFSVESFASTEGFKTEKQFQTRLLWKDFDDKQQSKLLLSSPETVLAIAVRGQAAALAPTDAKASAPKARRKTRGEPSPK